MLSSAERADPLMFTAELLQGWLDKYATGWLGASLAEPWLPSIAKMLNAYGSALSVKENELEVGNMLQKLAYYLPKSETSSAGELKQKIGISTQSHPKSGKGVRARFRVNQRITSSNVAIP
jgi:hypothetical protein